MVSLCPLALSILQGPAPARKKESDAQFNNTFRLAVKKEPEVRDARISRAAHCLNGRLLPSLPPLICAHNSAHALPEGSETMPRKLIAAALVAAFAVAPEIGRAHV